MGGGESRLRLAPTRNPERPENLTTAYKMRGSSSVALTDAQNLLRQLSRGQVRPLDGTIWKFRLTIAHERVIRYRIPLCLTRNPVNLLC
jgi:hypothetical protein